MVHVNQKTKKKTNMSKGCCPIRFRKKKNEYILAEKNEQAWTDNNKTGSHPENINKIYQFTAFTHSIRDYNKKDDKKENA